MRLHFGVAELQAGNIQMARQILEDVLATLRKHHGADHPLVGQTMLELSGLELEVGNPSVADELLQQAMVIYREQRDDTHPDIELILRMRADALSARRQKVTTEDAQKSQQQAF